ncbi:MAG: hypothetical protein H6732_20160 [Alphaproteobacteria bacterium]|nr:hypothetical protein [Alphaproteobacteria bacterium]
MRFAVSLALLSGVTLLSAACGPTCAQTCSRFYAEDQCDARPAGLSVQEAVNGCVEECSEALRTPGPDVNVRDPKWNPEVPYAGSASSAAILTSAREAAAWMDCVWTFQELGECREQLSLPMCARVQ